jgi:hypothetical protein
MAAYGGGAGELGRVREVAGEVRVVVEGNAGPFIGRGKGEVAGRRVAQGAHSNGGRDARSLVEEGGDQRGSYGAAVLNGTGTAAVKRRWRAETTTASRQGSVCARCCWLTVMARAVR